MNIRNKAIQIVNDAERTLNFTSISEVALFNQEKVLNAFRKNRLAYRHFSGTNGYGYGDEGRDTLNRVFADVLGAEDAIVSPYIASGTHSLYLMLNGLLTAGDTTLSVSGRPYETLNNAINGKNINSLTDNGIFYRQVDLLNGEFDYKEIRNNLQSVKVVLITRSRGYEWRDAQSLEAISDIIKYIKNINNSIIIAVDNCYGEFMNTYEPLEIGADVMAGSLIKNLGGGIAPSGGYIAGKKHLIEQISYKLTAPGLGREIGSYALGYQLFFQGLFMAPTTVMNAVKCSMLMGQAFYNLGLETMPLPTSQPYDIIRSIKFNTKEQLIKFCRSIQSISPIDSFVTLEPWAMPGYDSDVIMAAGTFVAGASIELSADSPIREPYIAYLQGALTYEHAKLATIYAVESYLKE